jgi:hypothetical protein
MTIRLNVRQPLSQIIFCLIMNIKVRFFENIQNIFGCWVIYRTNTEKVLWCLSSFTGGGRPQVSLRTLFQAQAGRTIDCFISNLLYKSVLCKVYSNIYIYNILTYLDPQGSQTLFDLYSEQTSQRYDQQMVKSVLLQLQHMLQPVMQHICIQYLTSTFYNIA